MTIIIDEVGLGVGRNEDPIVAGLRRGDAEMFRALVEAHHAGLRRVARLYVSDTVVDDVVQETWIGVIRGIDRFEGRSSLKTWIYRILINQARKRGVWESKSIPFSAAGPTDEGRPAVDPERLINPELGPNYWPHAPSTWEFDPEDRAMAGEVRAVVTAAIELLPDAQREVIVLRDLEGWKSEEICQTLGISTVNQRVLLHRARTRVRRELEEYFDAD